VAHRTKSGGAPRLKDSAFPFELNTGVGQAGRLDFGLLVAEYIMLVTLRSGY
jgi:hypothetical protein